MYLRAIFGPDKQQKGRKQLAKKVVSNSLGLVDFAIALEMFVLNLPNRQVVFFWEIQVTERL